MSEKAAQNVRPTLSRSLARLAVVQALFQIEFAEGDPTEILDEFLSHRLQDHGDLDLSQADKSHFRKVVDGVMRELTELNDHLRAVLPKAWPITRLDPNVRAILRAAAFELAETSVPKTAVVSEYVGVADAFCDAATHRFVQANLNALADHLRPEAE